MLCLFVGVHLSKIVNIFYKEPSAGGNEFPLNIDDVLASESRRRMIKGLCVLYLSLFRPSRDSLMVKSMLILYGIIKLYL